MEHKNEILNSLKKSVQPTVDDNFFTNFKQNLMEQLTDSEASTSLDMLKKRKKPELPADYFKKPAFDAHLILNQLDKREQPKVSPEFFTEFPKKVRKTKDSNTKIIRLIISTVSIAAVFAVLFSVVNWNAKETQFVQETTVETENSIESILSYVDESEIINFMIDEGVNFEEDTDDSLFLETYYDFTEAEIADFYLEL